MSGEQTEDLESQIGLRASETVPLTDDYDVDSDPDAFGYAEPTPAATRSWSSFMKYIPQGRREEYSQASNANEDARGHASSELSQLTWDDVVDWIRRPETMFYVVFLISILSYGAAILQLKNLDDFYASFVLLWIIATALYLTAFALLGGGMTNLAKGPPKTPQLRTYLLSFYAVSFVFTIFFAIGFTNKVALFLVITLVFFQVVIAILYGLTFMPQE